MTRLRALFRFAALVVLLLAVMAGIEKIGRSFPQVMPLRWQLMQAAINSPFKPVPDQEIGFLAPPGPATDSKGFPNKEPWPERAAIVFLGDSLITSGVEQSAMFTSLIADLLPAEPVVNLGLPMSGVERQTLVFRRFGAQLRPRIVVACLYLSSDFNSDKRFRSWVMEGRPGRFSDYSMPGDPPYVSVLDRVRTLDWQPVLQESWVYTKAREQTIRLLYGPDALPDRYRFRDGTETLIDLEDVAFANAQTNPNDPRIDALLESLNNLRALVTSHNATLVVALIPTFEELFRSERNAERSNVVAHTRARLRADAYPVVDLYPALRAGGRLQTPYLINDDHLNAYGNQIVAHEFVAWFQRHRPQ